MSRRQLVVRYAAFAAAAIAVNVATQHVALILYDRAFSLPLAIACGTAAGLLAKYLLDKHWIFFDTATGIGAHSRRFALYTSTGVVTTAVFWGMETGFHLLFGTAIMRDIGAIAGLTIGYIGKYQLDRRFVFDAATADQT